MVDDEPFNRVVEVNMLEKLGFTKVQTACNGKEALEALSETCFDLVLMDWLMPKMDGLEATRRWRQSEAEAGVSQRTLIIAVTARREDGDREECLAMGMDDYIAKPLRFVTLKERLRQWLPPTSH